MQAMLLRNDSTQNVQ